MPFEVLHRALVGLGLLPRRKGPQVATLAGFRILLARVQPVFARREFADHRASTEFGCVFRQRNLRPSQPHAEPPPITPVRNGESEKLGGESGSGGLGPWYN